MTSKLNQIMYMIYSAAYDDDDDDDEGWTFNINSR